MIRTPWALRLTLLIPMLLLVAAPALASVAGVHSLQIPPGARANGLGEASVAIANDATAPWWNPAGLGFMKGRTLGLMHSQLVPDLAPDIYYEYLGWISHMEGWGSYSVSIIYLSYGKSVITEDSPEELGTFTSFEVVPTLSYGVQLSKDIAVGLSLKYARVDLAPEYAILDFEGKGAGTSMAVDFGALYRLGNTNFGAVVNNIGPNISFINNEQSDPLPRHVKMGVAHTYYLPENLGHVLATFDYSKMIVEGGPTTLHGGVEFQYSDIFALRVGRVEDPDGDITDFTYGAGFHVKWAERDIFFDYANIPQASDLERVHRLSLELLF